MSKHLTQSGFSLVETLVAITILLIVIIGPMTIISSTANSTSFASEQVVAFFLAQEGAELAQKARDDAVLPVFLTTNNGWQTFSDTNTGALYEDCFSSTGCGLWVGEDTAGTIQTPSLCASSGCPLYYNAATNNVRARYTHANTGTLTEFTRTIKFETVSANEIRVISTVQWFNGSLTTPQSVEVETYLFNVYGA